MVIVGFTICGSALAFIVVPFYALSINYMKEKHGLTENNESLDDKISAIHNTLWALGSMAGPPLGGLLNDTYGFRITCDIMMLVSLCYAIFFFFVIILPSLLMRK